MDATVSFGGWFNERSGATGSSLSMTKIVRYGLFAATMLVSTGTGGTVLPPQQRAQSHTLSANSGQAPAVTVIVARTPAEDLARIREVFSPAVSDLATALGVSRQAVYNWINGEQPKLEFTEKLSDLAQAADVLSHEGFAMNSILLKRKFANGKNIFQVAQVGESARNASLLLVQILKRETEQRERMDARFTGRVKTPATADFDLPASNDLT